MVENFKKGGAAINQLCNLADIKLSVVPIDLENPTKDLSENKRSIRRLQTACENAKKTLSSLAMHPKLYTLLLDKVLIWASETLSA